MFSGHVDYINICPAVFCGLRNLGTGDTTQVDMGDGRTLSYSVQSNRLHPANNAPWAEIFSPSTGNNVGRSIPAKAPGTGATTATAASCALSAPNRARECLAPHAYHQNVDEPATIPEEAQHALRAAMTLHSQGEIDAALRATEEVVACWPGYAQALSYLGQTLVTRKRRFADGLAMLDRAVAAGDDDPYIIYTAAWCREFVANALDRPNGAHQPVAPQAPELYAQAHRELLRALSLEPDDQLRGDVEDILSVIANVTGEPWDEGEHHRAAPRAR